MIDVGAGRGSDALWFARKGVPTIALDYAYGASNAVRRVAEEEGLDLEIAWVNLHELRSVMAQGARVAHLGGPAVVMANHLIDSTDDRGLAALVRFARMSLAGGGRFYAEFLSAEPGEDPGPRGSDRLRPVAVEKVTRALTDGGAVIVHSAQVNKQRTSAPR